MTIYSSNISDFDQPAEPIQKKQRKRKVVEPIEESTEHVEPVEPTKKKRVKKTLLSPPTSNDDQADEPKPKKERTPAQIAVFEKAKITRQRKKEEAQAAAKQLDEEIAAKEKEIADKEAQIAAKKAATAEKRRLAREAKKIDKTVDEIVEGKSDDKPPKWFTNYVQTTRIQEAKEAKDPRPVKEIQQEAKQEASNKWGDGLTRDRVTHERQNYNSRMFATMFGRRL